MYFSGELTLSDEEKIAKIAAVQDKYNDRLLAYPNVVGTGIGLRERQDKTTDELCLVVMVSKKLPAENLPASGILPRELDGVGIDVIETGAFGI